MALIVYMEKDGQFICPACGPPDRVRSNLVIELGEDGGESRVKLKLCQFCGQELAKQLYDIQRGINNARRLKDRHRVDKRSRDG